MSAKLKTKKPVPRDFFSLLTYLDEDGANMSYTEMVKMAEGIKSPTTKKKTQSPKNTKTKKVQNSKPSPQSTSYHSDKYDTYEAYLLSLNIPKEPEKPKKRTPERKITDSEKKFVDLKPELDFNLPREYAAGILKEKNECIFKYSKSFDVLTLVLRHEQEECAISKEEVKKLRRELKIVQNERDEALKEKEETSRMNLKLAQKIVRLKEKLLHQKDYFSSKMKKKKEEAANQSLILREKLYEEKKKMIEDSRKRERFVSTYLREEKPKPVTHLELKQDDLELKIQNFMKKIDPPPPPQKKEKPVQSEKKASISEPNIPSVTSSTLSSSKTPKSENKKEKEASRTQKLKEDKPEERPSEVNTSSPSAMSDSNLSRLRKQKNVYLPSKLLCLQCNATVLIRNPALVSLCPNGHPFPRERESAPKVPTKASQETEAKDATSKQVEPPSPSTVRLSPRSSGPSPSPSPRNEKFSAPKKPPPRSPKPSPRDKEKTPPPSPHKSSSNETNPLNRSPSVPSLNLSSTVNAPKPPVPPPPTPKDPLATPRVPFTPRKDMEGFSLVESIRRLDVNPMRRMSAIQKAKEEMTTERTRRRSLDPFSSLFLQIKQLQPNSQDRLKAMKEIEEKTAESKKKIADELLQKQMQQLKSNGGIEKLEEERRKRDQEFFAMIPSFQESDDEYSEEEEMELEDSEEDEDLSSAITSLLSGENKEMDQSPSDGDLTSMIESLMQK